MKKSNHLLSQILKGIIILVLSHLAIINGIDAQEKAIDPNTNFGAHPRILFFKEEETAFSKMITSDPFAKNIHEAILKESDRLIDVEPIKRIQIGRRLLDKSREALRRIFQLSYAYRVTHEKKYFDRTEKEMLAIAEFSDWNPTHFLDVAEMTMAVAIGYDWLHQDLSNISKQKIKEAIIEKGLKPSLDNKYNSWLKAEHNWNQVCNAGMTYGALAVYEEEPKLAVNIINRAIESIKLPMKDYGPDGIYPEGYGYWGYGTSFNVMFLSAIEKLFKTDFGLCSTPGFLKTAAFLEHMTAPSGNSFNYSDAGLGGGFHPAMFWLANRSKDETVLWEEKNFIQRNGVDKRVNDRLLPAILFWKGNIQLNKVAHPAGTMWVGTGKNPIAMMRTSWTDPNAIYVATKGGSASINHAHMDIGSFIMEANGVRWAMDFGMQDYESLESKGVKLWGRTQDSERWNVFRLNNFAHNTLIIDSQFQQVAGTAPIIATGKEPNNMFAVLDLSSIYAGQVAGAKRTIAILDGKKVQVQDEIQTNGKETRIRWNMLTPADVEIIGNNKAVLKKDGKQLTLHATGAKNITMKTWSTKPPRDYDAPNPGTILVGFEAIVPADTKVTLKVLLQPGS
jgi:hypothetical protein